jgi:hypothetical protein
VLGSNVPIALIIIELEKNKSTTSTTSTPQQRLDFRDEKLLKMGVEFGLHHPFLDPTNKKWEQRVKNGHRIIITSEVHFVVLILLN